LVGTILDDGPSYIRHRQTESLEGVSRTSQLVEAGGLFGIAPCTVWVQVKDRPLPAPPHLILQCLQVFDGFLIRKKPQALNVIETHPEGP